MMEKKKEPEPIYESGSILTRFVKSTGRGYRKNGYRRFMDFPLSGRILMIGMILAIMIVFLYIAELVTSMRHPVYLQPEKNPFLILLKLTKAYPFLVLFVFLVTVTLSYFICYNLYQNIKHYDRHGNLIDERNLHGSAHEMTKEEMQTVFKITPIGEPRGTIIGIPEREPDKLIVSPWKNGALKHAPPNKNCWIVGGSGSGKTKGFLLPNIYSALADGKNVIYTDPKGEITREAKPAALYLHKEFRQFNVDDFLSSDGWDCTKRIRDSRSPEHEANLFVQALLRSQGKSAANFFGPSMENILLVALLYVCKAKSFRPYDLINMTSEIRDKRYDAADYGTGLPYYRHRTFDEVYKLITSTSNTTGDFVGDTPYRGMEQIIGEAIATDPKDARLLQGAYNVWVSHKEKNNNLSSLAVELQTMCPSPEARKVLSTDEIDLKKILKEPSCLAVICPDGSTPYAGILALFFTYLFQTIREVADREPNQRLPIRNMIVFEELGTIGQIGGLGDFLAMCRSRESQVFLCTQELGSIRDNYSYAGNKGMFEYLHILGNCGLWICCGANDHETARYFEERSGLITVFEETESGNLETAEFLLSDRKVSSRSVGEPVFREDEIMRLKSNEALVCPATQNVFLIHEYFFKNHPLYRVKFLDRKTGEIVKLHPNEHVPKWRGGDDTELNRYYISALSESEIREQIAKEQEDFLNEEDDPEKDPFNPFETDTDRKRGYDRFL